MILTILHPIFALGKVEEKFKTTWKQTYFCGIEQVFSIKFPENAKKQE